MAGALPTISQTVLPMRVRDFTPATSLQPFISGYKIIETDTERVNRILPNTSLAIAFRIRGENLLVNNGDSRLLPESVVSGLQNALRLIGYGENTTTLIVQFKPAGASAFFREPLHNLFSQSTSLDDLVNPLQVRTINDLLFHAESDEERISIVERFLFTMLRNPETDRLVSAAIQHIHQVNGFVRVSDLCDKLYISKDAFEKRFRKVVGAPPKQFASIVRMSSIIRQTRGRDELLDAAFQAGFFDESHFVKAFRQFTGQNPTDFSKSGPVW